MKTNVKSFARTHQHLKKEINGLWTSGEYVFIRTASIVEKALCSILWMSFTSCKRLQCHNFYRNFAIQLIEFYITMWTSFNAILFDKMNHCAESWGYCYNFLKSTHVCLLCPVCGSPYHLSWTTSVHSSHFGFIDNAPQLIIFYMTGSSLYFCEVLKKCFTSDDDIVETFKQCYINFERLKYAYAG